MCFKAQGLSNQLKTAKTLSLELILVRSAYLAQLVIDWDTYYILVKKEIRYCDDMNTAASKALKLICKVLMDFCKWS